ncbi:MAG: murein biosynthesis integral membrane protein MurJ [Nitrospirota bacterium]
MAERDRIARAAGLMSAATMISRVLGYARDMVLAYFLGASGVSDAFFLAFRIPNLLRELFAEGSTASAVIPVLTEYQGRDPDEARRLVQATLGFVLVVVGAVSALGVLFAPQVVAVIASGFKDPSKISLTVTLTRVMFPFLLFVSLASAAMGALNVRRVFFLPAVAPAFLNLSIIASVLAWSAWVGRPVMGAALGVTLGGLAQFLVQTPAMRREGYRLRPVLDLRHPGLTRILRLVLPVTVGVSISQLYILAASIIASFLPAGSITYLFYSMRLIQFPIGVFGVAMGMAVLPSLSEHARKGDMWSVREDFSFSLRLLFFITVPAMAGLIALREPIVNLLFQRGDWNYQATAGTARALLYYSMGIWAVVGVRVVTSTFYSLQDTKTPAKVAALGLAANIALCLALMGPMLHAGLALAHALAATLNFGVLLYLLRRRLGSIRARAIGAALLKAALASAVMGALARWLLRGDIWQGSGQAALKAGLLTGVIALSLAVYAGASRLLRNEELAFMIELLKRRLGRRKEPTP